MVSAVYILHWPDQDIEYLRCELIMHRTYHNDVPDAQLMVEQFTKLYRTLQPEDRKPCLYSQGIHYMYIWGDNDILIASATRHNVNVMLAVTFLHHFYLILQHYFNKHKNGKSRLDRDKIVDNFALVYELLDECIDFGMVQVTDYNILKEYIKMEMNVGKGLTSDLDVSDSGLDEPLKKKSDKKKKKNKKKKITSTHNHAEKSDVVDHKAEGVINSSILRTQALSISWRPKGIFYPKNEIYIDIIEQSEFLYDLETSSVKVNEIYGVCQIRSYLSGMPQCKLGLNEKYISKVEYDEEEEDEVVREGNILTEDHENEPETETALLPTKRLKVPINNVQFHQCIELTSIYKDNLILFTPPDGEFELLSYTVDQQRRKDKLPLIMVDPIFRVLKLEKKLQIMCSLTTTFKKRLHCRNLVVTIPVNPNVFWLDDAEKFRFKAELGDVHYKVDTSELVWAMDDLPGSKRTVRMMAEVHLRECQHIEPELILAALANIPTERHQEEEESAMSELDKYYGVHGVNTSVFDDLQKQACSTFRSHDVQLSFELPFMTYSGLRITYLSVEENVLKYTCFPWVRYLTKTHVSEQGQTGYRFRIGPLNFQIQ